MAKYLLYLLYIQKVNINKVNMILSYQILIFI